jgi:hypothetical protein
MKYLITGLLIGLAVLFSRCLQSGRPADPRGAAYAGSEACRHCHAGISGNYLHTHHFQTSSVVAGNPIPSAKDSAADRVYFADSSYVRVEENTGAFFQSYYRAGQKTRSESFDIAFGSGEKAQTYGYWKNDQLLELPLTWYSSRAPWQ